MTARIQSMVEGPTPMSEADLQTAVIQLAQLRGWLVHHCRPGQTAGGRWATQLQGDAGFPDLVLVRCTDIPPGSSHTGEPPMLRAELLFVELKSTTGKGSAEQARWLDELAGLEDACPDEVQVLVWRPANWRSGEIERRLA